MSVDAGGGNALWTNSGHPTGAGVRRRRRARLRYKPAVSATAAGAPETAATSPMQQRSRGLLLGDERGSWLGSCSTLAGRGDVSWPVCPLVVVRDVRVPVFGSPVPRRVVLSASRSRARASQPGPHANSAWIACPLNTKPNTRSSTAITAALWSCSQSFHPSIVRWTRSPPNT
jgi:hypothetical protein